MKKLLTATILATTMTSAYALPTVIPSGYVIPQTSQYQAGYNSGYHKGKSDAYNKIGKTVFFVGLATIAGVFIYELGKESCWTVNENGVVYRF